MSKKGVIVGAVAVLVVAALLYWVGRRPEPTNTVDLVAALGAPETEKRTTQAAGPAGITVEPVTIDDTTKQSIVARPHTRLIYEVTVPPDAWLETSFALKPDAWEQPGDGAQFRIGVSEGSQYDELLRQYVNPQRGDRRWFSARLDLSAYEGRTIKLIFNTDPGPPGATDTTNDEAVWAEPRVYSQR